MSWTILTLTLLSLTFCTAGTDRDFIEKPCTEHLPIPCGGPKGGCYSSLQHCNGFKECPYGEDEINCTSTIITKHLVIDEYHRTDSNLAWLVTPVIFAIGVVYAVYKCFKEGICNRERYRYRNRSGDSNTSDYVALDNMTFYSLAGIPVTRVQTLDSEGGASSHPRVMVANSGSHPRVMVVHNHSYAVMLAPCSHVAAHPPSYEQVVTDEGRRNNAFSSLPQEELPPYQEEEEETISLAPPPGSPPCEYPPPPPFPDSPRSRSNTFHIPPSLPGSQHPSIGTLNLNISRRTSSSNVTPTQVTPSRRTSASVVPPLIAPPPGGRRSRHSSAPQGLGRQRHNSQPQNRQRHLSSHTGGTTVSHAINIDNLL